MSRAKAPKSSVAQPKISTFMQPLVEEVSRVVSHDIVGFQKGVIYDVDLFIPNKGPNFSRIDSAKVLESKNGPEELFRYLKAEILSLIKEH